MKKAHHENYPCWKGTQPQHNHEFEVLNNMDDVLYSV